MTRFGSSSLGGWRLLPREGQKLPRQRRRLAAGSLNFAIPFCATSADRSVWPTSRVAADDGKQIIEIVPKFRPPAVLRLHLLSMAKLALPSVALSHIA